MQNTAPVGVSNTKLGASEERARALRAAGSTALVGRGGAAGKASVCTTPVFDFCCHSWFAGLFQPAGVPSGRGASRPAPVAPLGLALGFGLGRSHSVVRLGGEVSSLPVAQPGAQGDAGLCFGRFSPSPARPRPSARALGASEESATARRAAGSTAVVGRGGAAGKASVCTTRGFSAIVVIRGLPVGSSPPGFQAGVVQAGLALPPRPVLLGFQAGPLAFFGPVGGRSVVPSRGPTRRSRGRGVMLWPVFPQSRPPAPLSSGVGRKRRKRNSASGGRVHGGSGPWRCGWESLRLHHAGFFGYCCHSWFGGLFQSAGVPSGRGASRSGRAAPSGFCLGFGQLRPVQVFGWVVGEVPPLPAAQPGA